MKTSDGYILKVFRIPRIGSKKPAVFMLHGVQGTSAIFVGLGRQSLGMFISAFHLILSYVWFYFI